jgi:hypothetical protein
MIDRLVHHAEVIPLKGDSYRLKTATSAASPQPPRPTTKDQPNRAAPVQPDHGGQGWGGVDSATSRGRRSAVQDVLCWSCSEWGWSSSEHPSTNGAPSRLVTTGVVALGGHRRRLLPRTLAGRRCERVPTAGRQRSTSLRETLTFRG